jgi:histidinol dehydrogenase
VRVERLSREQVQRQGGPAGVVEMLRRIAPTPAEIVERTRAIVNDVKEQGDEAVLRYTRELDTRGSAPRPLLVSAQELDGAIQSLPLDVVAGLQVAIENVANAAQAGVGKDATAELSQGQRVTLREIPVQAAAVYVPGGRAPYPSTAVMGVVTARAAGVADVVVCSPPGADGQIDAAILGACRLLGIERVYRMGGAQAVAALAFGTNTVERVDVIVGPGNLYVQEAKREVAGVVGIDGFAGPSDLMVVLGEDADPHTAALDLLAQAEHGAPSLVVAVSSSPALLDRLSQQLDALSAEAERGGAVLAPCELIELADTREAIDLANAFAPEHLQLMGAQPEALRRQVRTAGCLLVGSHSATAFSDYVAGSNHILPTAGAGRFSSGLSIASFRRKMWEVEIDPSGATKLARAGAPIARAEGFEWHARSMEARAEQQTGGAAGAEATGGAEGTVGAKGVQETGGAAGAEGTVGGDA